MPPMQKTGTRFPWLPGPLLSANVDPLRQTIIIGAIVPALLLGGAGGVVGQRPLPQNTDPLRPTTLILGQQPVPGASVWKPEPARVPNTDPLRPTVSLSGQQPVPGASVWKPEAPRLPNTDPLRPVALVQDPPDTTLAQPSTAWVGRLSRDEDTSRPARPLLVVGVPVPVPGAVALATYAPRDVGVPPPDRLALTQLIVSQPPIPGAVALGVGRITETPTLRLVQTVVLGPAVPLPGAVVISLYAPRDVAVAPSDRLALTQVIVGQPPVPGARALVTGIVHDGDRLVSGARVVTPPVPVPGAVAAFVGRITSTPTERGKPVLVIVGWVPVPAGVVYLSAHPYEPPLFIPVLITKLGFLFGPSRIGDIGGPGPSGRTDAPARAGDIGGPGQTGQIGGPETTDTEGD